VGVGEGVEVGAGRGVLVAVAVSVEVPVEVGAGVNVDPKSWPGPQAARKEAAHRARKLAFVTVPPWIGSFSYDAANNYTVAGFPVDISHHNSRRDEDRSDMQNSSAQDRSETHYFERARIKTSRLGGIEFVECG
jgi:hypothetical protein